MKLIRYVFGSVIIICAAIIALFILSINIKCYYTPVFEKSPTGIVNKEVFNQLMFLEEKMDQGAASDMQMLFPEGFIFMNALYGLSWCELLKNAGNEWENYDAGMREVNRAIKQIFSSEGKKGFNRDLPLKYGAFYSGWSGYLLGEKLLLQRPSERDSSEIVLFKSLCKQIADAFCNGQTPYLESYYNAVWPADNVICIAVLKKYGELFDTEYEQLISEWIEKVKMHPDPATGLIPHSVNSDAKVTEGARGSSQSLMLNFLMDIDNEFAQQQFILYKKHFLDYCFGLPGIREYPKGIKGEGDIDSGPLIFGFGGAATIVGMRTMYRYNQHDLSKSIANSVEGLGFSCTLRGKKKYFFGKLVMADAFIAWANSINDNKQAHYSNLLLNLVFHAISVMAILFLVLTIWFIYRKVLRFHSS